MTNININFFLIKISHIQLNYAFLLFWSIFDGFYLKFLFLVKKNYLLKEAQK